MQRSEAENQARVWAWWTGQETRVRSTLNADFWQRRVRGWRWAGDLTAAQSPELRRAIEARADAVHDYFDKMRDEHRCVIWLGRTAFMETAESHEMALWHAARAAADAGETK